MLEQRIQQQFFEAADLLSQAAQGLSRPVAEAVQALTGCVTGGGKVLVAGFDHISAIKPLLASGAVVATADQHADQLAVFGIEAAREMLKTKATADRATPVDLVTR